MPKQDKAIVYADEAVGPYTLHRRETAPSGQDQFGYGDRIRTSICLKFRGEKKEYRVYAICYSNAVSLYIMRGRQRLFLRTHFQDEILDD